MRNFTQIHKLDKEPDGAGGGTPPADAKDKPNPPSNNSALKAEGDNVDDYGYEKTPASKDDKEKAGSGEKKDPAPKAEDIKDPATGYGSEPPKVEDAPPAAPPATPPAADELDKALEGLPKDELSKIKEFAKKNNVTVDQAKAFAELRKQEIKDAETHYQNVQKEVENDKLRIRAGWHKELKEDKDFGGEKFAKSIQNVEKVLQEFMPSTKKMLTETKGMLPPYVMRDIAKLADHLYKVENIVQGDPSMPAKSKEVVDDALAFYE